MNGNTGIRRLLIWAMLAQYGLVVSGLPLPMATPSVGSAAAAKLARKDRSTPFPCMDKACGCDSADRCFTACCCHTSAETFAWAKRRGIEPAVIEAVERRTAAARPRAVADGCSTHAAAKANCVLEVDDVDNAICSDYQSLAAEPPHHHDHSGMPGDPAHDPDEKEPSGGVVILRAALACGGVTAQWAGIGTSLPPPAILTCDLSWPLVGGISLVDERVRGAGAPPDLPPPRG